MGPYAGGVQPASGFNQQLLLAIRLVQAVERDQESLLPQALRDGAVVVSETRIHLWQRTLHRALSLLERIPAPLIFPPPVFIRLINTAVQQINQVLATLSSIPVASTRIYPPQPGRAAIPLETLQFMLQDLREAVDLLVRALYAA